MSASDYIATRSPQAIIYHLYFLSRNINVYGFVSDKIHNYDGVIMHGV